MSALLLRCPQKPHQVSDDVESFVHVINWLTLRFQVFSTPEGIDYALTMYEEYRRNEQGFDVGGSIKSRKLKNGNLDFDLDMIQPPALKAAVQRLLVMCKEHYSSPEVVKALSDAELQPEPLALSPTPDENEDNEVPAPQEEYPRHACQDPVETAPVGGKPLMDGHREIQGILYAMLTGSTDPTLWQGVKFGDQFLKRPKRTCLTDLAVSASAQGSATSPKHSESYLQSTQYHNVSSTHSKRSLSLLDESEVQGRFKRVKRSDEEGLVAGIERNDRSGDGPGLFQAQDPFGSNCAD